MNAELSSEPGALFELVLRVPAAALEPVGDALLEQGALSVSVEDADAFTDAEQPLFGEPGLPAPRQGWQHSRLLALFSSAAAAHAAADLLALQDFFAGCELLDVRSVAPQDWVRLTQEQFAPVPITPSFWIVPTWHDPPPQARHLIRLDPGLAFGTGTHPSTRMCLRWIAQRAWGAQRVLDYGCGSGILAIGAAQFGAREIVAVDIDPAAVESTRYNASANQVTLSVGQPELAQGEFDLVLANILATPLKLLAPLLCAHVRTGGHLVLAGILVRQTKELSKAYAPWLNLQVSDEAEGWVLMTALKA